MSQYTFSNITEDHHIRVVYEPYAKLSVVPESEYPNITNGNSLYNFNTLMYEVRDSAGRTVKTFMSNAAGSIMSYDEILPGSYTIVSINDNGRYKEASNVGSVTVQAGDEVTVTMYHPPVYDNGIAINKGWALQK